MITSLTLTDFRSYASATLPIPAGPVVLHGPNGAGKTNLLEALSLFTPGRGLRSATAQEMGRREPGEAGGRAWAVALTLDGVDGDEVRLGTGVQVAGAGRRMVRIDGETAQPGRLLDYLRPVWATPEQDRLFSDARAERLKFFDRLVFAADPGHAAAVAGYEKALRERLRLLIDGAEGREADPLWLDALEARLGETGARAATARARALTVLQNAIDARSDRPFPQADLALVGETERLAQGGADEEALAVSIREGMARARSRDGAASRSLFGPHRADLTALHREKNRPAAEGSSGEQKALVLNLILAQVGRLSGGEAAPVAEGGADEETLAASIREGMARARSRDGAAGRSLFGPHRADLTALHREKNRPAAEGSSGEQKALVLNLILAQVGRLSGGEAAPILLLDEAPAHLDSHRRAALFEEITALGLQAFMTGTEAELFEPLVGRAAFVRVEGGALTPG